MSQKTDKSGPLTVHQVSRLTGVSIRTLHYYDQLGLLTPDAVTEAGWRLYDRNSLERLQDIMLFRELEFSLKDIGKILDAPCFDRKKALCDQIRLLELKKEHLDQLIRHAENLQKEEYRMNFEAFDRNKLETYQNRAREAWGNTEEYMEYEERSKNYTGKDQQELAGKLMELFCEFGGMKEKDPADAAVQAQVKKLQEFITANYYTCPDRILSCLGEMYAAGGEMTDNINAAGGKGCADFVKAAIRIYCS